MSTQETPLVSVCMITYNHQDYIRQALDSILSQKMDFPFEIVIGDDGSKDQTGTICAEYVQKHPGRINYLRREPNLGMMPNFISTLQACNGKYIALCEGDDYWTDNSKLKRQVDFMESQPDHSLCCHLHSVLTQKALAPVHRDLPAESIDVRTEEYLVSPFFHTSSYFFRNDALPDPYPAWYRDVLAGDHFLVLFLSLKGRIGCLNKRMSVFRNHGSSVSFTRTALDIKQNFVKHLELFDQYSGLGFHKTIRKVIRKWDLLYKVYEPVGYFKKLSYFIRNTGFYLQNFRWTGGFKLGIKYLLPNAVLRRVMG